MTRVLLLCEFGALGCRVLYCLVGAGAETYVLANRRLSLKFSRYIKKFGRVQFPDNSVPTGNFVDLINKYVAAHKIDCVMAGDIKTQALLHNLKPKLQGTACYPVSSGETLNSLHDKWLFHQLLKSHNLLTPTTILLQNKEDVFRKGVYSLNFPVMLKPRGRQAGKGVLRADTVHEIADHVFGSSAYNQMPLLVQEFVPGADGGLSLLAINGKIVLSLAQKYEWDGSLSFFANEDLLASCQKIIEVTNYSGVAHIDCRWGSDGSLCAIVECNPRFWYSMPAAMTQGINFLQAGLNMAMSPGQQSSELSADFHHGPYYPFRAALKNVWRGKVRRSNLQDLALEVADILPHLHDFAKSVYGSLRR